MADGGWLLLVVHRHLQLLPRAECGSDRRLDLNDAARLRVATHPCGALPCLEIAEAGDLHLRALLQLCGDDALVVDSASTMREASPFDIFVLIASADVSSA